MLYDTHMHTRFSTDSQMLIEDALRQARALGIGVTVTEHMDLAYPGEPEAFVFDVPAYFAAYEPYRSDAVQLGVEIGMRPDCLEDNRHIAQSHPFDYVIGSIHVIDDMDIYHAHFYRGRTKTEVYERYFAAMMECLQTYDFIHSLGHIDYIARYAHFSDPEIYHHEFPECIDPLLELVAAKGIALEINTRRLDRRERIENILPVYRRFAELGGRLVTIGSDAHQTADVGRRLSTGVDLARTCGLTVVRYVAGKPVAVSL